MSGVSGPESTPFCALCGWLPCALSVSLTIDAQTRPGPVSRSHFLPSGTVLEVAGAPHCTGNEHLHLRQNAVLDWGLLMLAWSFRASPAFLWTPARNKPLWCSVVSSVSTPGGFDIGNQRARVEPHWISKPGWFLAFPLLVSWPGSWDSNCCCTFFKTIIWAPPCGWKEHCRYGWPFFSTQQWLLPNEYDFVLGFCACSCLEIINLVFILKR